MSRSRYSHGADLVFLATSHERRLPAWLHLFLHLLLALEGKTCPEVLCNLASWEAGGGRQTPAEVIGLALVG